MVGIIFVHGIVGNNRIFDSLKPLLPEGCEVRYVVLEGHGGDALAFSRASMSQWKAQVEGAIAALSERCEKIIGVGHSMGCLLLLNEAARGILAGLYLLNPPMSIRPRLSLLGNAQRVAAGNTDNNPVAQAAKEAYGISLDFNPLHYYGWPRRYLELFIEIGRVGKKILPKVKCPVRAMLSAKDEMVALGSKHILERLPVVTVNILPESTHYYYSERDRAAIHNDFRDMLSNMGFYQET